MVIDARFLRLGRLHDARFPAADIGRPSVPIGGLNHPDRRCGFRLRGLGRGPDAPIRFLPPFQIPIPVCALACTDRDNRGRQGERDPSLKHGFSVRDGANHRSCGFHIVVVDAFRASCDDLVRPGFMCPITGHIGSRIGWRDLTPSVWGIGELWLRLVVIIGLAEFATHTFILRGGLRKLRRWASSCVDREHIIGVRAGAADLAGEIQTTKLPGIPSGCSYRPS